MTPHFALYFVLPLAFGTVGILATTWLYIINDYGTWRLFLRHKTRSRIGYATIIAWLAYVALDAVAYQIGGYAALPENPGYQAAMVAFFLCPVMAAIAAPVLYSIADGLVQTYGKIGERRTGGRDQDLGIYARNHAGRGGEYHI